MPHAARRLALLTLVVAAGPVVGQPPPPAPPPQSPTLTGPANLAVSSVAPVEVTLTGTNLLGANAVLCSAPGVTAAIPAGQTDATKLRVKLTATAAVPVGVSALRVGTPAGVSNARVVFVDHLPLVAEIDGNTKKESAQPVSAACAVGGTIAAESADYFRLSVSAGQTLTFEVVARRTGSPLDPTLILHDAKTLRELPGLYADDTPGLQTDARLTHTFPAAGEVIVEVRDATYRGGPDFAYRLRIGEFASAMTAFPLAADKLSYVTPPGGKAKGFAVPVLASNHPETVEVEPNDTPETANVLPVPGGVSARFGTKADRDHFRFPGKKGQKLDIWAKTHEVNAPTEVYFRVLDAKGAELAKSDPAKPAARIEFTPPADGDYTIAAEHTNYLFGPTEVYHLSVRPAAPDFDITLGLDRFDIPAGGTGLLPITGVAKRNGFNAAVELSVTGLDGVTGKLTLPAGANPTPQAPVYLPITAAAKAKPGAFVAGVTGTATIDGKPVTKPATVTDIVRISFGGLPNLPPELAPLLAGVVVAKPAFVPTLSLEKLTAAAGTTLKAKLTVTRDGAADDITLALVTAPAGVTLKAKPVAKGSTAADIEFVIDAKAAAGAGPVIVKATGKAGGTDTAYFAYVPTLAVTAAAPPAATPPKK